MDSVSCGSINKMDLEQMRNNIHQIFKGFGAQPVIVGLQARMLNRIDEYDNVEGRKSGKMWSPERSPDFCCSQCGLNHEARDFIRAVLMQMIDQFQSSGKYIELLKRNGFIGQEIYDRIIGQVAVKT